MPEVELKITANTNDATKAIADLESQLKELEKQMESVYEAGKKGFSDIDALKANEKQLKELRTKHGELTKTINETKNLMKI